MVKIAVIEVTNDKSISRKIWVTEKSSNLQIVF